MDGLMAMGLRVFKQRIDRYFHEYAGWVLCNGLSPCMGLLVNWASHGKGKDWTLMNAKVSSPQPKNDFSPL